MPSRPSRPTAAQRRRAALREALDAQRAALDLPPYAGPDRPAPVLAACADAVLEAYGRGGSPERAAVRAAVRGTLDELAARAPGHSLEVRVPPFGAVQVVEGPRHTRGTPPGVVETDPRTWLELAAGLRAWDAAVAGHAVAASGERADLGPFLPLWGAEGDPGGARGPGRH